MSTETSDCELRDEWLLEQDVNAWSSLAYVAAGLALAWEVRRARLPRAVYGLAAITVAEGFGSLLYHGAASDFGQFLHDVPLIGALAFVAGWHVGRLRGRADAGSLIGLAIGLVVSTVVWVAAPDATNIAVGVAVVVIVVASLVARHRSIRAVWSWPLLGLGAFGDLDVGARDTGKPGVRRRLVAAAARTLAPADRDRGDRLGRSRLRRCRPRSSAAPVPPIHRPHDRPGRTWARARVPSLGRRALAGSAASRTVRC